MNKKEAAVLTEIGQIMDIEVTDAFGGEANYSWVRRYTAPYSVEESRYAQVRRAKKECGFNGVRCKVEDYGDSITLRPYNKSIVIFINYR